MEQETAMWMKEEETDVVHNEPGPMFLRDPLKLEEHSIYVKQEVELKLGEDDSEQKLQFIVTGRGVEDNPFTEEEIVSRLKSTYESGESILRVNDSGRTERADMTPERLRQERCPAEPMPIVHHGLKGHLVAAMEQETAMWVKEEEADMELNEPDSVGHTMAATEQLTAVWIKEEETDVMLDEPGSVFLQDPLKIEEDSLHIKQDVELKQDADDAEQKVQVYPSSVNVKEEMEDGFNQEYLVDPWHIEDSGLYIKQDPEVDLDVDGPEHNVVASRSYASNSTRLLQSNERCDFTGEETVNQGVSHNNLETGSEESTQFIVFREGEEEKEEESLSAPTLKCSLRANKCQTLICSVCQQSFTSKYGLMMHVFVHIDGVEPPKSVCKFCGEVFPSYVSLKKHLKVSECEQDSSADKEETFDCSGKSLTQMGTLKGHALIDTESRTHKCDICGKSFSQLRYLRDHTLRHTGMRPHKCDICGKSFSQLRYLRDHTLRHTGMKPHKCDICGKSFTQLGNLKTHSIIHTGTRPHKCDICGKSYTQLGTLKTHSIIHTGTFPHKCDICGKSFTQLSYLRNHTLIHTGTFPHKCDICGKSFNGLHSLRNHTLIHNGTFPHKCDICGKSFNRLHSLRNHTLIHNGPRPHKCDICDKSFTHLHVLKKHALIHTVKLHKCDICDKSFTYLYVLKKHALIHTRANLHKCYICGQSFTQLNTLKSHTLIHTGTKPHKCDICGTSFTDLRNLKIHASIHTGMPTGMQSHKCDICGMSFTQYHYLKRHSLIHTGILGCPQDPCIDIRCNKAPQV